MSKNKIIINNKGTKAEAFVPLLRKTDEKVMLFSVFRVVGRSHLFKAFTAIYRTVVSGNKRNASYAAASTTYSFMHLSGSAGCVFTLVTAGFAALGLVYETFLGVELLFTGRENEFVSAFLADESFVFVHDS